jgi:alkanesulfonate monooxygenase SsuD/methylene tetrahydromethanopterin reductase-like flavin-dependent oxidoreductase (luciferase family)
MLGLNIHAATTDAEARLMFSSHQQAMLNNRLGRPGQLPPPVENFADTLDGQARMIVEQGLNASVVGAPETVKRGLAEFIARTQADEIMVNGQIFDHAARLRSFEIVAQIQRELGRAA